MIDKMTNTELRQAICSLPFTDQWAERLNVLLKEQRRRCNPDKTSR